MSDIMINALNIKITSGELEGSTVREYFEKLLLTLWDEGEDFSSKRPFVVNGGWEFDLTYSLVECGYIPGEITRDEYGYVDNTEYDEKIVNNKMIELIKFMCKV